MSLTVSNAASTRSSVLSRPTPLGLSTPRRGAVAAVDAGTVNAAVYAPDLAQAVLHWQAPGQPWVSVALAGKDDGVHHGVVRGIPVGSRYAYSGTAVADPGTEQLLLDPYGRYIENYGSAEAPLYASVRMDGGFDWGLDLHPRIPPRDAIYYEAHVRGQSMLHPDIPQELRGTYAGMAHPTMIAHLRDVGVTSVQLLPIHFHLDEPHLLEDRLANYWGYNTLGYFAPQASYATAAAQAAGPQAVQAELKGMVKLLHDAGIEVILDVVYNHTAEGSAAAPALSWRGLAEDVYYRNANGAYIDTTGCGNTLDTSKERVRDMVLDSMRYWVEEFRIDGFRFDLAVSLSRDGSHEFDPQHPFLLEAAKDPALRGTKLIAEPWDLGYGGWQTGRFPRGWADWNDHFRDYARRFWLSDQAALRAGGNGGPVSALADALSGSAALFGPSGRSPLDSINFITAHDGFTLADLTAYNTKHNEANGEDNRDGNSDNRSWNHGVEGPTTDPAITAARSQSARNLMATLLLSRGVPMITAGDELGRSQRGNNNAYCQDNEITWLDWSLDAGARTMLAATRSLVRIRRAFLSSQPASYQTPDTDAYLRWCGVDGAPMTPERWSDPRGRVLQMLIGAPGGLLDGLLLFNASPAEVEFRLPDVDGTEDGTAAAGEWTFVFDTAVPEPEAANSFWQGTGQGTGPGEGRNPRGGTVRVAANSIRIYRRLSRR
ncbi:glycogen debranching protein GlgX [Pseudarthrobacter sp. P1]|uniref:glycogen debranching protein GlgX n=1 Tax=Pseudarthrobacter sp. P1 TaxID=3418418 RepID=UPI003CF8CEC3